MVLGQPGKPAAEQMVVCGNPTPQDLEWAIAFVHVVNIDGNLEHPTIFTVAMPETDAALAAISQREKDVDAVVTDRHAEIVLGDVEQPAMEPPMVDLAMSHDGGGSGLKGSAKGQVLALERVGLLQEILRARQVQLLQ